MVPTVEQRRMLEKRLSLVGLEGLAEETRVPVQIINNARMGRWVSPRNMAKLQGTADPRVVRRRRGG